MIHIYSGTEEFIALKSSKGEMQSSQNLIVGDPGFGKTTVLEAHIDRFIRTGGICIIMHDPKGKLELGFAQFNPENIRAYHKQYLDYYALRPEQIPVKIWHPLSMKIPKHKIPEMQFFSFALQSLNQDDIIFLLESEEDIANRELLLTAFSKLKAENSLYDLMRHVNEQMQRKEMFSGKKTVPIPDPERYGLLGAKSSGTIRELSKVYTSFERFKLYPLLQPQTSPFNFDPKELFQSDVKLHLFSTMFVKDQKTSDFVLFKLMEFIAEQKQKYFRGKVLLVFDELPHLFSDKDSTLLYKKKLVARFSKLLRQDSRIRGISTISASHSLSGLDRTILKENLFNTVAIGKTTSKFDLEMLRDYFSFSADHLRAIQALPKNHFIGIKFPELLLEQSHRKVLRTIHAPFRHCEEGEEYFEIFANEYPERMRNYSYILSELKNNENQEKKRIMEEAKQFEASIVERNTALQSQPEKLHKIKAENQALQLEIKDTKKQQKEERLAEILRLHSEGRTLKEVGNNFGISSVAVFKILKQYKNKEAKKDENSHS